MSRKPPEIIDFYWSYIEFIEFVNDELLPFLRTLYRELDEYQFIPSKNNIWIDDDITIEDNKRLNICFYKVQSHIIEDDVFVYHLDIEDLNTHDWEEVLLQKREKEIRKNIEISHIIKNVEIVNKQHTNDRIAKFKLMKSLVNEFASTPLSIEEQNILLES